MKFLVGLIIGILLVPLVGYCYFRFGYAPVATASSPIPFEKKLAGMALHARMDKEYPRQVPFQPSEADLQQGAHLYRRDCAVCHGVMGQPKSATAKGMFPKPPELLKGTGVTDDEPGETYWKVANGIRLTGMPAYRESLADHDMWDISFVLARADKLPDSVKNILQQPLQEQ